MKRKQKLKTAFIKGLLCGLVLPFLLLLSVIAVRVYGNVRQDKAESYSLIARTTAENMSEIIQKYASVVEIAAMMNRETGVTNTETIQKEANDNHRISGLLSTEVGKFR